MQYAVIDIGSNSVRLMFVADGKVLYKTLNTTRLGEGLAVSPYLREEAMARTALAVADFFYRAKDEGAEIVYAFATAAVRSAKNGADFVSLVKEKCGLSVEVVSGETEAEMRKQYKEYGACKHTNGHPEDYARENYDSRLLKAKRVTALQDHIKATDHARENTVSEDGAHILDKHGNITD